MLPWPDRMLPLLDAIKVWLNATKLERRHRTDSDSPFFLGGMIKSTSLGQLNKYGVCTL